MEAGLTQPKYLGTKNAFDGLEALKVAAQHVTLISDEVTALCPVTGQPDFYTVEIQLRGGHSLESKSLKLYLQTFRDKGIFCEDFAGQIAADVANATNSYSWVCVTQKPRGGISIVAEAEHE
jgi:7-cyano-7-deazaguanine reductase